MDEENIMEERLCYLHNCNLDLLKLISCIGIVSKNIIHTDFAEYFYDSVLVIGWSALLFTRVLRITIKKSVTYITKLCSLTLGVYILHPITIMLADRVSKENVIDLLRIRRGIDRNEKEYIRIS